MKRVGFYGGSFNPAHAGHQAAVLHALATADLDSLIVAPVFQHPYGKPLEDFESRLEMCELMIEPFGFKIPIEVSDLEKRAWDRGGKGLTCNTVHTLISEHYEEFGERPHVVVITGSDVRKDLPKWEGYDQLQELCMRGWCSFFFIDRIPGLSSTAVRDAIKNGGFVDRWLPRNIHDYIFKNNLYK